MRETDFIVKSFADWFDCVTFVETSCRNVDMCQVESLQSYERTAWEEGSLNARNKSIELLILFKESNPCQSSSGECFTTKWWEPLCHLALASQTQAARLLSLETNQYFWPETDRQLSIIKFWSKSVELTNLNHESLPTGFTKNVLSIF